MKDKKLTEKEKLAIREQIAYEDNRYQIRKLLALPMNKRMNFLRKKLPNGGSCI